MSARTLHVHITNDPVHMENGYTVYLKEGGACWIIDPGLPPQAGSARDRGVREGQSPIVSWSRALPEARR